MIGVASNLLPHSLHKHVHPACPLHLDIETNVTPWLKTLSTRNLLSHIHDFFRSVVAQQPDANEPVQCTLLCCP